MSQMHSTTNQDRLEEDRVLLEHDPTRLTPVAEIAPSNGFMIDMDGNRVQSIYKTPRPCMTCGTMFTPVNRRKPSVPTTCSEPCRRRYATKHISGIGEQVAATRRPNAVSPAPPPAPSAPPPAPSAPPPAPSAPPPSAASPPTSSAPPPSAASPPTSSAPPPAPRAAQPRLANGRFGSVQSSATRKDAHTPALPFGRALRQRRQALGLSQQDVGTAIGRHANAVNNWERGTAMIPADMLARVATVLACSMEDLWYDRLRVTTIPATPLRD